MSKSKADKKMNRLIKNINKSLKQDVFGDRFWIQQVRKKRCHSGLGMYYIFKLKDRQEPERDALLRVHSGFWVWEKSLFLEEGIYRSLNDFIIKSNFWAEYWQNPTRYDESLDVYKQSFFRKFDN